MVCFIYGEGLLLFFFSGLSLIGVFGFKRWKFDGLWFLVMSFLIPSSIFSFRRSVCFAVWVKLIFLYDLSLLQLTLYFYKKSSVRVKRLRILINFK